MVSPTTWALFRQNIMTMVSRFMVYGFALSSRVLPGSSKWTNDMWAYFLDISVPATD